MTDLLVIFGVTGQQGRSVAHFVLDDAQLSKQYKVRGVCRNTLNPTALELVEKGAEVVKADLDDAMTIKAAVKGAHTVFSMTKTVYDDHAKVREVNQGKAIADAAVASGAKYLIFSSATHAVKVSHGRYPVAAYDSKAEIEAYIRTLPIESAFVAPATFMQNLVGMMAPRAMSDGCFAISNVHAGSTVFPWLDVVGDTGKFVDAILADPPKFEGKVLYAASCLHSLDEVAVLMTKISGKTVKYIVISEEKYRALLPPAAQNAIVNMFLFVQDLGYYGGETEKGVHWALQHARGRPISLEEYLEANPVKL